MMITLTTYSSSHEEELVYQIFDFFAYHAGLVGAIEEMTDEKRAEARETIAEWLLPPNELYLVQQAEETIGFCRINYRGGIAAWIEEVYVKPAHRGHGIGKEVLRKAEEIIRQKNGYEAVCMDVSPRNLPALKLYFELGYTDISLLTLRKEFGESKRDKEIDLFGNPFHY